MYLEFTMYGLDNVRLTLTRVEYRVIGAKTAASFRRGSHPHHAL